MNTKSDWVITHPEQELFYSASETIDDVVENFNLRLNSAEGESVTIDGITESVIIQDHSNPLNEGKTDKKILVSMDSVLHSGSIVNYDSDYWIVVSYVNSVDEAYKSAQIDRCNYNLKFLDSDGFATSCYCIIGNSSGDTNNEGTTPSIEIGDGRYSIKLTFDSETKLFQKGRRFLIDYNTINPLVYKIVHVDRVSNYYDGHGIITLIVEEDGLKTEVDSIENMIADYVGNVSHTEPEPTGNYAEITPTTTTLYVGFDYKTYYINYYNSEGTLLSSQPDSVWTVTVDSDHSSYVLYTVAGDTASIQIKATDESVIGQTIILSVESADESMSDSIELTVIPLS